MTVAAQRLAKGRHHGHKTDLLFSSVGNEEPSAGPARSFKAVAKMTLAANRLSKVSVAKANLITPCRHHGHKTDLLFSWKNENEGTSAA